MNIYIWDYLDKMSDSYHSEGGVVVVAETLEAARDLLRVKGQYGPPIPEDSDAFTKNPEISYAVIGAEPRVFTFPNAGCC